MNQNIEDRNAGWMWIAFGLVLVVGFFVLCCFRCITRIVVDMAWGGGLVHEQATGTICPCMVVMPEIIGAICLCMMMNLRSRILRACQCIVGSLGRVCQCTMVAMQDETGKICRCTMVVMRDETDKICRCIMDAIQIEIGQVCQCTTS